MFKRNEKLTRFMLQTA